MRRLIIGYLLRVMMGLIISLMICLILPQYGLPQLEDFLTLPTERKWSIDPRRRSDDDNNTVIVPWFNVRLDGATFSQGSFIHC